MGEFLEHLDPSESLRFCRLSRVALASGGMLICRTPSADGPSGAHDLHNDLTHRWGVTAASGHQLLQMAGFAPARFRCAGGPGRGMGLGLTLNR